MVTRLMRGQRPKVKNNFKILTVQIYLYTFREQNYSEEPFVQY